MTVVLVVIVTYSSTSLETREYLDSKIDSRLRRMIYG